MSEKIKEVVKRLRDRAEARRRRGRLLQVDDRMFDLIADEVEEAAKALEADRDNWRRQALDEDARANAIHKDSLAVGDMAAMRDALLMVKKLFDGRIMFQSTIREAHNVVCVALAKPPRNCDLFGGDPKMLYTAWFDWTASPSGMNDDGTVKLTYGEWLLERAKGGAHANR